MSNVLVLRAMLYIFVRYLMASGPRCLMCLMFFFFFFFFFYLYIYPPDSQESDRGAICLCHQVQCNSCLYCLRWLVALVYNGKSYFLDWKGLECMVYVSVDFVCAIWSDVVNCLLKAFALSMSVMVILVWKQMLLFCSVGGFLLVINFVKMLFLGNCFMFMYCIGLFM